ncbi:Transposase [Jannaschia aquimarina]|uniref:Transposase n=1 Tax=Jannaschia aquimarina TaxID=935700 RepID=A0A0D1EDM1_9RHOB|nr:IS110 family transposase [Jannaschia aquimarina]KIT15789.1 Transposase [Jannaschia aquimarina]
MVKGTVAPVAPRKPRNDAEAICEAVSRPTRRFVPVKSAERQAALPDHKARDFLARRRTQTATAIHAHLSEFGIVVAKGIPNLDRLLDAACDVPEAARPALDLLAGQLRDLEKRIDAATARVTAAQKVDPLARRRATIPGLGPIASSAFAGHARRRRQDLSCTKTEAGPLRWGRSSWTNLS